MEPYRWYYPHAGLLLPETERLSQRVMSLPTGTAIEPQDILEIGHIIRFAGEHGQEIGARLAEEQVHE
jgi:dTDP-4-amino-4,6-dideoxygalactose transaminase